MVYDHGAYFDFMGSGVPLQFPHVWQSGFVFLHLRIGGLFVRFGIGMLFDILFHCRNRIRAISNSGQNDLGALTRYGFQGVDFDVSTAGERLILG